MIRFTFECHECLLLRPEATFLPTRKQGLRLLVNTDLSAKSEEPLAYQIARVRIPPLCGFLTQLIFENLLFMGIKPNTMAGDGFPCVPAC